MAWPVLLHAALVLGRDDRLPDITLAAVLLGALALFIDARSVRVRWFSIAIGASTILVWKTAPMLLVFAPQIAINAAVGFAFASTLAPGREPQVARFARIVKGGPLPPTEAQYARRVTWLWVFYTLGCAVIGAILAAFAPLAVWSAFANVIGYAGIVALFVGEYVYRRLRFRSQSHASLLAILRVVAATRPVTGDRVQR
ncbi:MAG TPA: hypothetical protein VNE58_06815 [Casimicrobiaceae bacterium]|nr:hypothetical protein [Casimicrobiaceae bacterium]